MLLVYETMFAKQTNNAMIRQGKLLDCLTMGIIVQSKWRFSFSNGDVEIKVLNGNNLYGDGK